MKVLIAYATTEGQTRKIAEYAANWIRGHGHDVVVIDSASVEETIVVGGFDAYIIAGSLHMEKHQSQLVHFVGRHKAEMQGAPSLFISVSGSASRNDPASREGADRCIRRFLDETGWTPTVRLPVGGAIKYTKYNFLVRAVMKRISKQNGGPTDTSRDHELTDWKALEQSLQGFFTECFSDRLSSGSQDDASDGVQSVAESAKL